MVAKTREMLSLRRAEIRIIQKWWLECLWNGEPGSNEKILVNKLNKFMSDSK
jgi:hypothetical protein